MSGCYLCEPDNPDAAEEGCDACDARFNEYIGHVQDALGRP